jgi:hypothetical protein
MTISARAIAVQGVGFAVALVAVQGFATYENATDPGGGGITEVVAIVGGIDHKLYVSIDSAVRRDKDAGLIGQLRARGILRG